ncbi:hypothetical protein Apa02nite_084680 [Actinoplanes palleronii]|uniref:Uncharacterized protein n=1 Tax=Actinoplanes palleronii TaxID=113570 RepID=A0ABQ4BNX0_9ACTN|nr:hypothetical protein Apa02nite_084680 [Actinoplanes palleronii]
MILALAAQVAADPSAALAPGAVEALAGLAEDYVLEVVPLTNLAAHP